MTDHDGRVDVYASERHYADHLVPIWHALELDRRGTFYAAQHRGAWPAVAGVDGVQRVARAMPAGDRPTLVASWGDALAARGRPVALLEHGAGQVYVDDDGVARNPGYSGGGRRRMVSLFVCPSQTVADRNLVAYPDAGVSVVGCPKLDAWHHGIPRSRATSPTVAVSFHWENGTWPESRTALPEFGPAVVELAAQLHAAGGTLLGHAHPRARGLVRRVYARAGCEVVDDFADVLDRADVYVCDNSSTLFEFASTDRPVVLLNASWYRRNVEHGLRFWSHAGIGLQCDRPRDLVDVVARALDDPPELAARRRELIGDVYAHTDGTAAARAAAAVSEWAVDAVVTEPGAEHDPFRASRRRAK